MTDDLIVYVTVEEGIPGVGVPAGGTTGEVLTKLSDDDFDTGWGPGGGGGGSIAIGTTPITGGTSGRVLYDNAGVAGELATTGSGSVVLSTSPTLVTPALGTPSSGNLANCTGYPVGGISMNTARILGRTTAGTGAVEQLTAGANLTLSGGSLNANVGLGANNFTGTQDINAGTGGLFDAVTTDNSVSAGRFFGNGPGASSGTYLWAAYRLGEEPPGLGWPTGPAFWMDAPVYGQTFQTISFDGAVFSVESGILSMNARASDPDGSLMVTLTNKSGVDVLVINAAGRVDIGSSSTSVRIKTTGAASGSLLTATDANGSVAWSTVSSLGFVTLDGVQTLTNKTLTAPVLTQVSIDGGAISMVDYVGLAPGSGPGGLNLHCPEFLSGTRALDISVNDADRAIVLSGNLTLAGNFTTSGAFALTLTTTGATNVTLPTSGTLLASGGALGTPSSGTLTNCTGLPLSGVTGAQARIAGMALIF